MQKFDETIESLIVELEHVTESINRVLLLTQTNGADAFIGEDVEMLYEKKQFLLEKLGLMLSEGGNNNVNDYKTKIKQRLSCVLDKEKVNLQLMETYTNFLAHKLRLLQRQKSLRIYTGG